MQNAPLVIDKDIYDAIELVAESEGGLSAVERFNKGRPCCMIGAMQYAGVIPMESHDVYATALGMLGEDPSTRFDKAHYTLVGGSDEYDARLPWSDLAAAANIIRGN